RYAAYEPLVTMSVVYNPMVQAASFFAGEFEAPSSQTLRSDQIQGADANIDDRGRRERTDTLLSPPRRRRDADRRSGRAHLMSPLLPEGLLPFLYRMCAVDEELRKTRARP
ncbi:MAG: hypothetical protein V4582_16695, partial [Pseudomonadota bacterium]